MTMKVCLVTNAAEDTAAYTDGIFPADSEVLLLTAEEMEARIEEINFLVPGHIDVNADFLNRAKNLRLVHCGTGYNNVDLEAANKNNCYVCVTPNVAATSVAELVWSSLSSLKNHIAEFDAILKDGGWKSTDFIGIPEFKGKTFGVVGYGNIGREAARIARGYGMTVIAHDPYCKETNDGTELVELDVLVKTADFITLHVLLTPETTGLFGAEQFEAMKDTAMLVNACRGPVVDEAALVEALQAKKIAGACLDVFEKEPLDPKSPLRDLNNIVLTPHIAFCSNEALKGRYQFFADNAHKLASGEVPNMAVNADQVS